MSVYWKIEILNISILYWIQKLRCKAFKNEWNITASLSSKRKWKKRQKEKEREHLYHLFCTVVYNQLRVISTAFSHQSVANLVINRFYTWYCFEFFFFYLQYDFFPLCHSGVFKEWVDRRCHWVRGTGFLDHSTPYPKIPGWECQCAAHTAHPSRTKSMGRVRVAVNVVFGKDREGGRLWIRRGHSLSTCCYVSRYFQNLLIHRGYFSTLLRFDRLFNKLDRWFLEKECVSGESGGQ